MSLKGTELISDCSIELTIGRRYGLLGQNGVCPASSLCCHRSWHVKLAVLAGCGKTNFLQCLANREVPIPDHMDLYHLRTEAEPSERTGARSVACMRCPAHQTAEHLGA